MLKKNLGCLFAHKLYLTYDALIELFLALNSLLLRGLLTKFCGKFLWLIYFIQVLDSFLQFFADVILSFVAGGKLNEKESHARILEVSFLSFLAVLVHCVSHELEVDMTPTDHLLDVFLLKVVTQHNREDS